MATDKRPFAKIDVNWPMNPKWFIVERSIRDQMQDAMQDALPVAMPDAMQELRFAFLEAQHLHIVSILYCAQYCTDGLFPVDAVKSIGRCVHEEAVTALFDVGMWINKPGGMAEVRDYLEHQTSAEEIRLASEKGRKGASVRWGNDASGNASGNANRNATGNASGIANKNKNKNKKDTPYKSPTGDEFDRFWSAYPRKAAKQKARTKFAAACNRTDVETIIAGAQRLAADPNLPEQTYIPYPTTWLERDGWDDEPLPARYVPQRPSDLAFEADMRAAQMSDQSRLQIGGGQL